MPGLSLLALLDPLARRSPADDTTISGSGSQTLSFHDADTVSLSGGSNTLIGHDDDVITIAGGDNTVIAHDDDVITISGGGNTVVGHDQDVIAISGGGNTVVGHDDDVITIYGGGNAVVLHDGDALTINDVRTEADNFSGSVQFGDTIAVHNDDTIALNYSLALGNSDVVTVGCTTTVMGCGYSLSANGVLNAGKSDVITFAASGAPVLLNLGKGDTIATTGSDDTITIGGAASTKSVVTVGATATGTTINGGLGTDTFSAGSGYTGGNNYVGSAQTNADGFNAIGNCANYANLNCRVTVDLQTNIGEGFDAGGNQLWTDTYTSIQQVKAGQLDGSVLTGSDQYFCELKGSLGQTTFYGGGAGDRVIWSSAGATGLVDGQSTDIAYTGSGADEFYWRNSPGGKGVSNFAETIYGFNGGKGDDLNLSEFADTGFAGVTRAFNGTDNNLFNWVDVTLAANGRDTDVLFDKTGSGNFTQIAAVLKNENLFSVYGAADTVAGAQQVVQDMYNAGSLVLSLPH